MSIITKTKQIQLILESHAWNIREHALIDRLSMNMYPFPFIIFLGCESMYSRITST